MPKYANSLNVETNIPPPYILSQVPANLLLLYVINLEVASVSLLLLPCGLPKAGYGYDRRCKIQTETYLFITQILRQHTTQRMWTSH